MLAGLSVPYTPVSDGSCGVLPSIEASTPSAPAVSLPDRIYNGLKGRGMGIDFFFTTVAGLKEADAMAAMKSGWSCTTLRAQINSNLSSSPGDAEQLLSSLSCLSPDSTETWARFRG